MQFPERLLPVWNRAVLKVGSSLLADASGELTDRNARLLADFIATSRAAGREVVLVSSGAVAAGRARISTDAAKGSLVLRQALAALGQTRMIALWQSLIEAPVAQVLLTHDDLRNRRRYLNARSRAAHRLQDGRQGRQRHLPARHAAGADLGLHQGRRQVEPRRRQGHRRPVEQQPRRARQGPARPGRQAVRRVEPLPHPPGRRAHHGLPQRQARRRSRPAGELLGPQAAAARSRGPIQLQTHGGEIRWRNIFVREIPADEANEILAQARRDGLRRRLQRQGLHRLGRAGRQLRGQGRRHRLQAEEGRHHLHQGGVRRLRRPRRVPAAAGRQQRPGDPLPRQGRRRVRRHVRAAGPRRRRRRSTPSSTRGSTTARPTAWSPPSAATCGRSASGTSRR